MYKLVTELNSSVSDQRLIRDGLRAFNAGVLGAPSKTFAIFVKDDSDVICGGLLAIIHGDSTYIDSLWVSEEIRQQGYGSQLMQAAEKIALEHECQSATVDTFGFQAEEFYVKNGYERLGEIKDYILGYPRIFLRKMLCAEGRNK